MGLRRRAQPFHFCSESIWSPGMCSATAPTAAAVGSMLVHASRVAATASRRSHSSPAVCKHADRVPRPLVCRSFLPSIARRPAHADGLLHDEWADGASGRATFHAPAVGRARVARVCGVCSRRACMGVQIRSEVACEHVCRFRLVPRRRSVPQSVQNRCPDRLADASCLAAVAATDA